jgi:solute carrier family 30 (zinc transporter), member 1
VFLIALCVSIILEALTRFVDPPQIENPKLILIVGSAGLFSNLVGFFVLGGHGHSHGHEGHGHDHHDHEHDHEHVHDHAHDEEHGVSTKSHTDSISHEHTGPEVNVRRPTADLAGQSGSENLDTGRHITFGGQESSTRDESNTRGSRASVQSRGRDNRRSSKSGHSRLTSIEDMSIHPASFRQDIIAASMAASSSGAEPTSDSDVDSNDEATEYASQQRGPNEESPLLGDVKVKHGTTGHGSRLGFGYTKRPRRDSSVHVGHNHTLPKGPSKGGHGHSHSDMGMNAMILHVIGDALGNVGVIVTALIIWLTDWPGKLYADPAVSLFITAIILKTSIPLTRATSRVLLQATPDHISIQEIRQDIEALPGVMSCHHIHVWQLSDTKVVASMHLQVSFPFDSDNGAKYMQLAKRARKCLHGFGIHSATIQPEFCLDQKHRHGEDAAGLTLDGPLDEHNPNVCFLECVDDCQGPGCCTTSSKASSTRRPSQSSNGRHSPHLHE